MAKTPAYRKRIGRAQVRSIRNERKAARAEAIQQREEYSYGRGVTEGRKQAQEECAADLKLQERKTRIDLARTLSSMVEATARAVVTFIGKGGLHG